MLRNRIIPIVLLRNGRCVKGRQFKDYRDTGFPVTVAKIYDAQQVDELIFLDITATLEDRNVFLNIITEMAKECFMPLTVGGGIRDIEDIRVTITAGADKVSLNTKAVERPEFIREAAEYFGNANIIVSIDYKLDEKGKREVYTHGGTKRTGLEALEWAKKVASLGVGEIILTSIDREGTMTGYDLEFIKLVSGSLKIPVIAHGGAGTLEHLKEGLTIGGASGIAAASIFHFTDQSPIKARLFLKDAGVNVRVNNGK